MTLRVDLDMTLCVVCVKSKALHHILFYTDRNRARRETKGESGRNGYNVIQKVVDHIGVRGDAKKRWDD